MDKSLSVSGVLVAAAAAVMFVSVSSEVQAQGSGRGATIQSVSYGGSGCPQGSVGMSTSNDRKTATLIFDSFVASTANNVPATESRKNCQINVTLTTPNGMSCSAVTADYRGYVQLPSGFTATQGASYYLSGQASGESSSDFLGPVSKDYVSRDQVNLAVLSTPAHGGAVATIAASVSIDRGGQPVASSQITTDSIDLKVESISCGGVAGRR